MSNSVIIIDQTANNNTIAEYPFDDQEVIIKFNTPEMSLDRCAWHDFFLSGHRPSCLSSSALLLTPLSESCICGYFSYLLRSTITIITLQGKTPFLTAFILIARSVPCIRPVPSPTRPSPFVALVTALCIEFPSTMIIDLCLYRSLSC